MVKNTIALIMLIWGCCQLCLPVLREVGGNLAGHVWLVGAVLLAWMPEGK